MKVILIDDEPLAIDLLKSYVDKVPSFELVNTFRDPLDAIYYIQNHTVDVIFLDINMPTMNGIDFLKAIYSPQMPHIIITSAHQEYAFDGFEFDVVDYLLKPFELSRFLKAINKLLKRTRNNMNPQIETPSSIPTIENRKETLFIKSGTEIYPVVLDDILYFEGQGNYVCLFTTTKKIMTLNSLKEVLAMLPPKRFFRIHRSYIISIDKINMIERHQVEINKTLIPIGTQYKDEFFEFIEVIKNKPK
jgi:DNA-binding LytR/AlgR family response regulator